MTSPRQRVAPRRRSLFALVGAVLLATGASDARAVTEIRTSIGLPPSHPTVTHALPAFSKAVEAESKGSLNVRGFSGGSLLTLKASKDGLKSGVADAVLVYAPGYYPAEFKYGAFLASLSLLGADIAATAGAATELNLGCPKCLAEFAAQGAVYVGSYSSPAFYLITRTPVTSVEQIKALKISTGSSQTWARWVQYFEATPVGIPANEMYSGLNSGNIDASIQSISALKGYSLWDVAKGMTLVNLGTSTPALTVYARSFWKSLTDDQRRALLAAAAETTAAQTVRYNNLDNEVAKAAAGQGVSLVQPDAGLAEAHAKFIVDDLETFAKTSEDDGVAEARQLIATYRGLVQKWEKLIAATGYDEAKLAALYRREIFDKLDPKTFGM